MLEIELELPSDRLIREVMKLATQRQGLEISKPKPTEIESQIKQLHCKFFIRVQSTLY